jgi:hypothetical protein
MKTLKNIEIGDFPKDFKFCGDEGIDHDECLRLNLRQSAINDIKQIRAALNNEGRSMPEELKSVIYVDLWKTQLIAIIDYIKVKFNITEEDLK